LFENADFPKELELCANKMLLEHVVMSLKTLLISALEDEFGPVELLLPEKYFQKDSFQIRFFLAHFDTKKRKCIIFELF